MPSEPIQAAKRIGGRGRPAFRGRRRRKAAPGGPGRPLGDRLGGRQGGCSFECSESWVNRRPDRTGQSKQGGAEQAGGLLHSGEKWVEGLGLGQARTPSRGQWGHRIQTHSQAVPGTHTAHSARPNSAAKPDLFPGRLQGGLPPGGPASRRAARIKIPRSRRGLPRLANAPCLSSRGHYAAGREKGRERTNAGIQSSGRNHISLPRPAARQFQKLFSLFSVSGRREARRLCGRA